MMQGKFIARFNNHIAEWRQQYLSPQPALVLWDSWRDHFHILFYIKALEIVNPFLSIVIIGK